ncbi:hypothetical protein ABS71_18775 [bacterium SCN 62-11]|nr:hypothetical protein [Candidatus Eremiobacteraeota bacterium]ODT58609.1 MAG: hypothetical protein ABS71_18775 [bacterium SCN 62-11]
MRRPRGIVLATSLFLVTLLYLLVLALLYQAHQNIRLRTGVQLRAQARFLSKGAVQVALARMNANPAWLPSHLAAPSPTVPPSVAEKKVVDGVETSFWVEPGDDPDFYRVLGWSKVNGVAHLALAVVHQTGAVQPGALAYSRGNGLFLNQPLAGGTWSHLTSPPSWGWSDASTPWVGPVFGSEADSTESLYSNSLKGLPDGTIFLSTRLNGVATVLMRAPSGEWQLLPPLVMSDGQMALGARRLEFLNDKLYAVARRNADIYEVRSLAHPAGTGRLYREATHTFELAAGSSEASWQLEATPPGTASMHGLAVSSNGIIYAVADAQRYRWVDGAWKAMRGAPLIGWTQDSPLSPLQLSPLDPSESTFDLRGTTASPRGELIINRQTGDLNTLFKYVPARRGPGYYKLLPPLPGSVAAMAVTYDQSNLLFMRAQQGGEDRVFFGDLSQPQGSSSYRSLPRLPVGDGVVNAVGSGALLEPGSLRYTPCYLR